MIRPNGLLVKSFCNLKLTDKNRCMIKEYIDNYMCQFIVCSKMNKMKMKFVLSNNFAVQ